MDLKIRYLVKRGDVYRYRRTIPAELRGAFNRREWVHSFRPGLPEDAIHRQVNLMAEKHDRLLDAARRGTVIDQDVIDKAEAEAKELLAVPEDRRRMEAWLEQEAGDDPTTNLETPHLRVLHNALQHQGTYLPDIRLATAYERDKKLAEGSGRSEKPIAAAVKEWLAVMGNSDLAEITYADCEQFISALAKRGLKASTVRRRLDAIGALWKRAARMAGIHAPSPFREHTIRGAKGQADDRLPFTKAHLAAIRHYLATSPRVKPETRCLITIMMLTGAGISEAGGLAVNDVVLDVDIPFIWIRSNAIRGLKTKARTRRIPLVAEALPAAREAVERARKAGRVELFGPLNRHSLSARLVKAIRRAGIPESPRLTPYSFRHGITEALRVAEAPAYIERRLLGHATPDVHSGYGAPMAVLKRKLDAVTAAMEHLGEVDDSAYSDAERAVSQGPAHSEDS